MVTFLFTDIAGSTRQWERDRVLMQAAVERHFDLLRSAVETHGGAVFKQIGDAARAAFSTAPEAVAAALVAQLAFLQEPWSQDLGPIRVPMALHAAAANPAGFAQCE